MTAIPTGAAGAQLSINDLVQLCAVDSNLFCTTFFPKACRQVPAPRRETPRPEWSQPQGMPPPTGGADADAGLWSQRSYRFSLIEGAEFDVPSS